jgi:hypothetical protein
MPILRIEPLQDFDTLQGELRSLDDSPCAAAVPLALPRPVDGANYVMIDLFTHLAGW